MIGSEWRIPVPLKVQSMITKKQDIADSALATENERLKNLVKELEEERDRNRKTIADLQKKQDDFLRYCYAVSRSLHSQEELERWANEEDVNGVSFSELLAEVEKSPGS